jgi:CheY-like chemotaxis protein
MHNGRIWLQSLPGAGATVSFSLPVTPSMPAPPTRAGWKRWFSPYDEYEYRARTRRSKAPPPRLIPRFVLLEQRDTLRRMFARYAGDIELVSVREIKAAMQELERSPAQALIVNTPLFTHRAIPPELLSGLPYNTPAVMCWMPGEEDASHRLGIVRYLLKPVTRQTLLSALEDLGEQVQQVLIVDDEPEVVQLFSRMLASSKRDYRILRASSGRRALYLLRERRPDALVLDLLMPDLDGFHLLQIKNQDPSIRDIPVVITSSRDPAGQPIVSRGLAVTRSSGLSVDNVLECISALGEILSPSGQPYRERQETPVV